jgi:hypothetical protein
MNLRSLGYRTDLIFPAFDGEIIDRGEYLAVRSPQNPTYYWGNFLLFAEPPKEGDLTMARDLRSRDRAPPKVTHLAFGWDRRRRVGLIEPFVQAGSGWNAAWC